MLRVVDVPGVHDGHRVACHWAEQIASGELQPHQVAPTATTQEDYREDAADPFGPQSVGEAEVARHRDETGYTGG